jgi:hypothetical protein
MKKIKPKFHICKYKECGKKFKHRTDSKNLYCSRTCVDKDYGNHTKIRRNKELIEKKKKYYKKPKLCKQCKKVIKYCREIKNKNFCNHSCAARVTNLGRPPSKKYKDPNYISPHRKNYPSCKVYFKSCERCEKLFTANYALKVFCSSCKLNNKKEYKKLCKFNFNHYDYPELFDDKLIKKYGWYTPPSEKNSNYTGVNWDHLYPVHMGFKNKVSPNIMSHPANAELVPHSENLRRYRKSKNMISLEELYERIKLWDSGSRNLTKFYKE